MLVEKRTLQYIRMNTFILCNIFQMNGHLVSTEVPPYVNECSGVVQCISIHITSCMCALLVAWTIGVDMALPCTLMQWLCWLAIVRGCCGVSVLLDTLWFPHAGHTVASICGGGESALVHVQLDSVSKHSPSGPAFWLVSSPLVCAFHY